MNIEERRAYVERTLRQAPEGSARRTWALAMLQHLDGRDKARKQRDAGGQAGTARTTSRG